MKKISLFVGKIISQFRIASAFLVVAVLFGFGTVALASHSWGGYHWARTSNPFALKLGDNVNTVWDSYLATTSSDWTVAAELNTTIVTGANLKNCRPVAGRVEVCNKTYGKNGWLGIAQVWISGSHITQGVVKVNDTYFNTAPYNTPEWRNLVMCQEVGHTLGLDHQDEIHTNANLDTCMDYTNNPASNQHPNAHDYEQFGIIYTHLDLFNTLSAKIASLRGGNIIPEKESIDSEDSTEWGKKIRSDANGRGSLYEKDLGKGEKIHTFVTWAE